MKRWRRRARRLFGRALPPRTGAAILGYHRIVDPAEVPVGDPFRMCVSPDAFRAQMRMLPQLGRPVSLGHLLGAMEAGVSVRGMIAVTFDDAYADVLAVALSEIESYEIPVTVFFVAGNAGRPFWWDRLAACLAEADTTIPFRVSTGSSEFAWPGLGSFDELRTRLHRALRILPDPDRERALDRLADVWRLPAAPDLPRAVTAEEARELMRSRWIEPGAHSVTHPPLAEISPGRAEEEIRQARAMLRSMLGRDVDAFSYPHGSRNEVTDRLVKAAGYRSACTSRQDSVRSGCDPFALPRVWAGNHAGGMFRRRLTRYIGTSARRSRGT